MSKKDQPLQALFVSRLFLSAPFSERARKESKKPHGSPHDAPDIMRLSDILFLAFNLRDAATSGIPRGTHGHGIPPEGSRASF